MKHFRFYVLAASLFILFGCNKDDDTSPSPPPPSSPAPVAAFDVSNSTPKVGEEITFTNTSQNATAYEWDFGDGTISTAKDTAYAYSGGGSFTVMLTATGDGGSDAASKTITVMDADPIAGFVMDKTTAGIGETVKFTNTSQNAMDYEWDFGDGDVSTELNPTHEYEEVGNYTIKLVAINNELKDSTERSIEVVIPANIFPGEKIKDLALGGTWGSVKDLSGYDFTEKGPILIPPNTWLHPVEEQSMGITFFLLGSGPIKSDSDFIALITIESPFIGITEKGIGLGSTLTEVRNAYGNEESVSGYWYLYESIGIDFSITSSEVEVIRIYFP